MGSQAPVNWILRPGTLLMRKEFMDARHFDFALVLGFQKDGLEHENLECIHYRVLWLCPRVVVRAFTWDEKSADRWNVYQ